MIEKMLRENNGCKDVLVNWITMILIICPLGAVSILGFFWVIFSILR